MKLLKDITLCFIVLVLSACVGVEDFTLSEGNVPLELSICKGSISVRGINNSDTIPDNSQISVLFKEKNKTTYDGINYNNVIYKTSRNSDGQYLSTDADNIMLSGTKGTLYAFYPGNAEPFESKSVSTSSQIDYLYADSIENVNKSSSSQTLYMKHALSGIRLFINHRSYSNNAIINKVTISGNCIADIATFNSLNGKITIKEAKKNTVEKTINLQMGDPAKFIDLDFLAIPNNVSGKLTFSFDITDSNGEKKVTGLTDDVETLSQGKINQYVISLNETSLSVSKAHVFEWNLSDSYRIIIDGDLQGINCEHKVKNDSIIINAFCNEYDKKINRVIVNGEDYDDQIEVPSGHLIIKLPLTNNVSKLYNLTFNGLSARFTYSNIAVMTGNYLYSDGTSGDNASVPVGEKIVGYCIGKFGGWTLDSGGDSDVSSVNVKGHFTKNLVIATNEIDSLNSAWASDFTRYETLYYSKNWDSANSISKCNL